MNLLALDTSTDILSIAVQNGEQVRERSAPGGAQSSSTLIPLIREMMTEMGVSFDNLDLIVFGRGPGSFTGLRTSCAAAQGLAFGARGGAGVPVLPVDSLLAVAEQARVEHGAEHVLAVLDARMDEVYVGQYSWLGDAWHSHGDFNLQAPQTVALPVATQSNWTVAGNAQAAYPERLLPDARHVRVLPSAAAMLRLAPGLLKAGLAVPADEALPLYIRDKVAQTTAERELAKLAAAQASNPPA